MGYSTAMGPVLAQADAGGFLTLYTVEAEADHSGAGAGAAGVQQAVVRETARLECGGGGLGMATCVDWNPALGGGGGGGGDSSGDGGSVGCVGVALAVCGADGGLRAIAFRESALEVVAETDTAHDLEAWAVAFARSPGSIGSTLYSGADDAAFKAGTHTISAPSPTLAVLYPPSP